MTARTPRSTGETRHGARTVRRLHVCRALARFRGPTCRTTLRLSDLPLRRREKTLALGAAGAPVDARSDRGDRAEPEAAPVGRHRNRGAPAAGAGPNNRNRDDRTGPPGACPPGAARGGAPDVRPEAPRVACAAQHRDAARPCSAARAAQETEARVHLRVAASPHPLHAVADRAHGRGGLHLAAHRVLSAPPLPGNPARHRCDGVRPAGRPVRAPARARPVRGIHHRVFRTHPRPEGHGRLRRRDAGGAAASPRSPGPGHGPRDGRAPAVPAIAA